MNESFSVLFVCMGNICRSPTAHGVFREQIRRAGLSDRVRVSSAATHDYHPGEPPDPRSVKHAIARGYDLSDLRARVLSTEDFRHADLVLVMDHDNLAIVNERCPPDERHKVRRLAEFCQVHTVAAVPDPYFGGPEAFDWVLDLLEDACQGLLETVRLRLASDVGRQP